MNFDKELNLYINKSYFLNVLMVLFENSYRVFEQRKIENPSIKIEVEKNKDNFQLIFKDNGLGIKEDIAKVFDKKYSLNNSTGLGLYLAKEIVNHKLNGKLSAKNIEDGICFNISLDTKES